MIVNIEEIGSKGLEIDRELSKDFLTSVLEGEGVDTGFRPLGPAVLHAKFEKVSGKVLVTGRTQVAVAGSCKRCLAVAQASVPVSFQLSLVKEMAAPKEDEEDAAGEGPLASFDPRSLEEELFDGHEIDLAPLVREQVLLALPMDLLCKESCKGLCSVCGADLNERECGCERRVLDPRWAALKDIKIS